MGLLVEVSGLQRPLCPETDLPGADLCGCLCKKNGKLSVRGQHEQRLFVL